MESSIATEGRDWLSGDNKFLVWGLIYLLGLAFLFWLGYGWREIQIQRLNSQIKAIQSEVYSQVDEEELTKLEKRINQLAVLYGRSTVSQLISDIEKSIPKNAKLVNINIENGVLILQGTAPDYRVVPLFATALANQSSLIDKVEIKEATRQVEGENTLIGFTLEAKL